MTSPPFKVTFSRYRSPLADSASRDDDDDAAPPPPPRAPAPVPCPSIGGGVCSAPRAGDGKFEPVPDTLRDKLGGKSGGSPLPERLGYDGSSALVAGSGPVGRGEDVDSPLEEEEGAVPPDEEGLLPTAAACMLRVDDRAGDRVSTSIAFGCGSGGGGCCSRAFELCFGGDGGVEVEVEVGNGAGILAGAGGGGGEGAGAVDNRYEAWERTSDV